MTKKEDRELFRKDKVSLVLMQSKMTSQSSFVVVRNKTLSEVNYLQLWKMLFRVPCKSELLSVCHITVQNPFVIYLDFMWQTKTNTSEKCCIHLPNKPNREQSKYKTKNSRMCKDGRNINQKTFSSKCNKCLTKFWLRRSAFHSF